MSRTQPANELISDATYSRTLPPQENRINFHEVFALSLSLSHTRTQCTQHTTNITDEHLVRLSSVWSVGSFCVALLCFPIEATLIESV